MFARILLALLTGAACWACDRPTGRASASPVDSTATTVVSLADAPDQFLDVGDATIRYRTIGRGTPVVMLHGYSDRLEMWNGPADSLARRHQVIVPDLRGAGKSSAPRDRSHYGLRMATDVLALIDDLRLERVHLVGYSTGGLLAAHVTLLHPERVRSVSLIAGTFWEDSSTSARELLPLVRAIDGEQGLAPLLAWFQPTWPDSLVRQAASQRLADNDRRALVLIARSLPGLALRWDRLHDLSVPALAVVGRNERLASQTRRLIKHWPAANLIEVHVRAQAEITHAPETLQAIRSFTSALESTAR